MKPAVAALVALSCMVASASAGGPGRLEWDGPYQARDLLQAANATAPPPLNTTTNATNGTAAPGSILAAVLATPDLSLLAQAAAAANLTSFFNGTNLTATVFAPRNQAILSALTMLGVTQQQFLANATLLTTVLNYHVVPNVAANASSLRPGQVLPTLLRNANLTVATASYGTANVTIQGGSSRNLVRVARADLPAGRAIVHIVDAVLVPPPLITAISAAGGPLSASDLPGAAANGSAGAANKTSGADGLRAATAVVASSLLAWLAAALLA